MTSVLKHLLCTGLLLVLLLLPSLAQPLSSGEEEKLIKSYLSQMTLAEKVGMLHGNSKFTSTGVPRLNIPEWHLSDGPHGIREEIQRDSWNPAGWTDDASTCFPTATALAATWNPALAQLEGEALGEEARHRKKDVLLGPGVNILRTPLGGRGFEYLSEDPYLTSVMAVAWIKAVQSRDVAVSVKHFLANNQEHERNRVDVTMSERALREIYLPAFRAAVMEGGALTVMGAYNKFRGVWCCENPFLGRTLLRNEFGFQGVYLSDWGGVHTTVESALAGLDLEMGTNGAYNSYFFADPLLLAVTQGKVPESVVNEKVSNILRVMLRTKVIGPEVDKRFPGSFNTPEHQAAAYKVASESVVLLRNAGGLLPLNFSKLRSVAVIGRNATHKQAAGGQSSGIKALYEVTPLEAMQKKWGSRVRIDYVLGYDKPEPVVENGRRRPANDLVANQKLLQEAVETARKADAVIFVGGLDHDYDTEGSDKPHMELPYGQVEVIQEISKVNPNVVVVIVGGSPVDMNGIVHRVPALVWAWFNGMEAGNALADVLDGKVNPSGKLPFTLPSSLSQSPAHALGNYPGKNLKVHYEEDIFVGYRWFDTKQIQPLFPFGFGLSYTDFVIDQPSLNKKVYGMADRVQVQLTVRNTGKIAGAETVQLYVGDPQASVPRPLKELKAFAKVFLQPGESRKITLTVPVEHCAFFEEKSAKWVVEPGEFMLYVGNSSRNIVHAKSFNVK